MYNWSTDEKKLAQNPQKHELWKLEQLVNFGLNGGRIKKKELKEKLPLLEIDPARRRFLDILLNA